MGSVEVVSAVEDHLGAVVVEVSDLVVDTVDMGGSDTVWGTMVGEVTMESFLSVGITATPTDINTTGTGTAALHAPALPLTLNAFVTSSTEKVLSG